MCLLPRGKWRLLALRSVSYQAGSRVTFRIHLMQGNATFETVSLLLWTLDTYSVHCVIIHKPPPFVACNFYTQIVVSIFFKYHAHAYLREATISAYLSCMVLT